MTHTPKLGVFGWTRLGKLRANWGKSQQMSSADHRLFRFGPLPCPDALRPLAAFDLALRPDALAP